MRLLVVLMLLSSFIIFAQEHKTITILHTNDLHGMLLPFDYSYNGQSFSDAGGLARRATLIEQERQMATNPVLLLDAGDIFTRGPWHKQFFGLVEVDSMNLMKYDAATIGNNEFKAHDANAVDTAKKSQAKLKKIIERSTFQWLAANVSDSLTNEYLNGVQPFIMKSIEGLKIGIIGLTAPRSADYPQTENLTIVDPIIVASQLIPLMRKDCDIIIALTHVGSQDEIDSNNNLVTPSLDRLLAMNVSGIDAIVGGDSHTFIYSPIVVKDPEGDLVPIVQAGEQGLMLGKLNLTFLNLNGEWKLKEFHGQLLPINSSIEADENMSQLLNSYLE